MNTYYECYTYERQFQLFVLFPERLCNARNTIRFDIRKQFNFFKWKIKYKFIIYVFNLNIFSFFYALYCKNYVELNYYFHLFY
jgi:hypothetical protein